jgi:cation diffusion facilitator family transporter
MASDASPSPVPRRLFRLLWLSVAAAAATISLKTVAWLLTGSVGLLSDAAESVVNLVAAVVALGALHWATRPADEQHAYGHAKAEYLSAGFEGALILLAAVTIAVSATDRLLDPQPLSDVGVGLAVAGGAALINLAVGLLLLRAGREHRSITLEADGRHLLTDVWTSVGVIAGVALVAITGWERLDPIVALAVAANIVLTGARLLRSSAGGLMDQALEETRAGGHRSGAGAVPASRRPVPRDQDAPGRPASVHLDAHPGPGRLDGPDRARSRRGGRSRPS